MSNYVNFNIALKEEFVSQIQDVVKYKNVKSQLRKTNEEYSAEDFIVGTVIDYLDELFNLETISGNDDLGRPYRLKNNLKSYIHSVGMKQKDLAIITGIDAGNISHILNNKSQPSLDYFLRIWSALGHPPLSKILYREVEK